MCNECLWSLKVNTPMLILPFKTLSSHSYHYLRIWHILHICAVLSHFNPVRLFATLWTVAHQAPLSMGFSRQEYWRGLPCPPTGDLSDSGIEHASLKSLALAGTITAWEAHYVYNSESGSCSVMSDSLWPYGLYSPWNSPDQNTGVGSLFSRGSSQPRGWT